MSELKKELRIGGMTCINCQNRIEQALRGTEGVTEANINYNKETAWITFDPEVVSLQEITAIIENLDYEVLGGKEENKNDICRSICILVIVVSLYVLLQQFGILNLLVPSKLADTGMGYGMLFVIGVITSVHCIAMCGGINLTQCIPKEDAVLEKEGDTGAAKRSFLPKMLGPSLLYNMGRVISYTVIGFLLGAVGMLIGGGSVGLSTFLQGILKLIAGIFMVIMGINMLHIFPWLRGFQPRLPKALAVRFGKGKRKSRMPLVVGLLNGLMPCGPLQSMQIVALASANPFAGALSMFLFSLGTVPLMLGLGSIVSALGRQFTQRVMGVGAVLVTVLGLAMLSQGGSLSGMLLPDRLLFLLIALCILGVVGSIPFEKKSYRILSLIAAAVILLEGQTAWKFYIQANTGDRADAAEGMAEIEDGVQMVTSTLSPGSYPTITVQEGIPVKWVIDAPEGSINGCNYKMILKEYGIEHEFKQGENIIEFTPTETGSFGYTCWMGMIHGTIYVTDGNGTNTAERAAYSLPEDYESAGCCTPEDYGSADCCTPEDYENAGCCSP